MNVMHWIKVVCTVIMTTGIWLSPTAAEAQAQPIKYSMTIGVGGPSVELAWPILLADQLGYFADEGIQVTKLITAPGATLVHAFTSKDLDFLAVGITFPINLRAGGFRAKTVLEFNKKDIFQLAVRTELKNEVKTVSDLKGRKVGFLGAGGLAWMAGLVALKSAGLDPDRGDFQYINIGSTPAEVVTALQQGKIDAAPLWEPMLSRALRDKFAYVVLSSADPEQNRQWWGTDRIQDLTLVTREDLVAGKQGMLKGAVLAVKRALDFIQTQTPERIADVILAHPKGKEWWGSLDRDIVIGSTVAYKAVAGDGCISKASFDRLMGLLLEYKIAKKAVSFSDYGDTRWAGSCPE